MSFAVVDGAYVMIVTRPKMLLFSFVDLGSDEAAITVWGRFTLPDPKDGVADGVGAACLHDHQPSKFHAYALLVYTSSSWELVNLEADKVTTLQEGQAFVRNDGQAFAVTLACRAAGSTTKLVGQISGETVVNFPVPGGYADFDHAGVAATTTKAPAAFKVDDITIRRG